MLRSEINLIEYFEKQKIEYELDYEKKGNINTTLFYFVGWTIRIKKININKKWLIYSQKSNEIMVSFYQEQSKLDKLKKRLDEIIRKVIKTGGQNEQVKGK